PSIPLSDIPVTFTVPAGTPVGTHTFNVYVVDDAGVRYGAQTVTIHVVIPSTVTVTHIVPTSGSTGSLVYIKNLGGTGFAPNASVILNKTGCPNIAAVPGSISVESALNKITCTFNLTGADPGLWNITVTNPDTGSGTLVNGFTVIDGNTKVRK
ncbi:MAG: hypothetical protein LUQ33_05720, partial [Methanoregulaceae archaeon]|nr:hypothetical protein [Methanoregulaceae archaeon]